MVPRRRDGLEQPGVGHWKGARVGAEDVDPGDLVVAEGLLDRLGHGGTVKGGLVAGVGHQLGGDLGVAEGDGGEVEGQRRSRSVQPLEDLGVDLDQRTRHRHGTLHSLQDLVGTTGLLELPGRRVGEVVAQGLGDEALEGLTAAPDESASPPQHLGA